MTINDITIQKPVCNSQYSYVYSRLGLHLIVSRDYLSGRSVGKNIHDPYDQDGLLELDLVV